MKGIERCLVREIDHRIKLNMLQTCYQFIKYGKKNPSFFARLCGRTTSTPLPQRTTYFHPCDEKILRAEMHTATLA